jgi:omega-amidase
LEIAIVQHETIWEDPIANCASLEELIWTLREPLDLIVLPETFNTGFTPKIQQLSEIHEGPTFRWMKQMAAQFKAVICGTLYVRENHQFYNRFYAVYPNGTFYSYNKQHLFVGSTEHEICSIDQAPEIFVVKNWKILPAICFDIRFPELCRNHSNRLYDVLLVCAQWPEQRKIILDRLCAGRSIENQAYTILCNASGKSLDGSRMAGHSGLYTFLGDKTIELSFQNFIEIIRIDFEPLEAYRTQHPFLEESKT